jgi:hypothetical protein
MAWAGAVAGLVLSLRVGMAATNPLAAPFNWSIHGPTGALCVLLESVDLVTWRPACVFTFTPTPTRLQIASGGLGRFVRAGLVGPLPPQDLLWVKRAAPATEETVVCVYDGVFDRETLRFEEFSFAPGTPREGPLRRGVAAAKVRCGETIAACMEWSSEFLSLDMTRHRNAVGVIPRGTPPGDGPLVVPARPPDLTDR